jgi:hypothetical protein
MSGAYGFSLLKSRPSQLYLITICLPEWSQMEGISKFCQKGTGQIHLLFSVFICILSHFMALLLVLFPAVPEQEQFKEAALGR